MDKKLIIKILVEDFEKRLNESEPSVIFKIYSEYLSMKEQNLKGETNEV